MTSAKTHSHTQARWEWKFVVCEVGIDYVNLCVCVCVGSVDVFVVHVSTLTFCAAQNEKCMTNGPKYEKT